MNFDIDDAKPHYFSLCGRPEIVKFHIQYSIFNI